MENTSKQTNKLIRIRDRAYYRRRQQNRIFARLAKFFAEEAEAGRITKREIAEKLGKDPAQITRWLSGPANLESDTISDILLTMGAEMDHQIVRFSDRLMPNYAHPLTIEKIKIAPAAGPKPGVTIASTAPRIPSATGSTVADVRVLESVR